MSTYWPIQILDALEALDREEVPHGLYGLRQAYASKRRIPTLAHLFSSTGKASILARNGFEGIQTRSTSADIYFSTGGGESVGLHVLEYATTKVRHYGSTYRLDKHYAKKSKDPNWELESLVPKLSKNRISTRGILLLAHFQNNEQLEKVLGRSTEPDFLSRYHVTHTVREWQDRFGRDFRTAVHLWSSHTTH
jgi:hypothetical protein